MKRYTVKEIKESFNSSAGKSPLVYHYIFRPISFYLTVLSFKFGLDTPNKATGFSLFLGLLSMLFFILPAKMYFTIGFLLYCLEHIFDFVDGNIARVNNQATYYGKFLDGTVGVVVGALLPVAIGIRMYILHANLMYLVSSMSTAIIMLFACYVMVRASFFNNWIKLDRYEKKIEALQEKTESTNPLASKRFPLQKISNLTLDLAIVILFIAIFKGMTFFLFILLLASTLIWSIMIIFVSVLDSSKQLNIHRLSKWDSRIGKKNG